MAHTRLASRPTQHCRTNRSSALRLVGIVWCEIYVAQGLWPSCGGTFLAFSLALVTVEGDVRRGQGRSPRKPPECEHASLVGSFAAYSMVGLLLQPWLGLVATEIHSLVIGTAPRLSPIAPDCTWRLGATLVLAPIFEERLYRGTLLIGLQARIGSAGAAVLSSVAFAAPHVDSLAIIGTFLAGLVLGSTAIRTRRMTPCIAMHFGFNLAAIGAATLASRTP